MLYSPSDRYVWDTWYFTRGDSAHVIHLQMRRPGSGLPDSEECTFGHAVSEDLIHWRQLPMALRRGEDGAYDDGFLYTGCCVEHEGRNYLFYASNHYDAAKGRAVSGICLATSDDAIEWTKHPSNPVAEPDSRWYHGNDNAPPDHPFHSRPHVDCRDIAIVRDPEGSGWLGYIVMRRKVEGMYDTCCVALYRSQDLIHWEAGPPCCTPDRFICFEVPDVFCIDGRWYMIALTGDGYGQRRRWADGDVRRATLVFESESAYGPFVEVRDNLLLASMDDQGFSARTIEFRGERLMFYTRPESPASSFGRLSRPVKLVQRPGGGLLPVWWDGAADDLGEVVRRPGRTLSVRSGWATEKVYAFDEPQRGFMVEAPVDSSDSRSFGIALASDLNAFPWDGYAVIVDRDTQEISLVGNSGFRPIQRRRMQLGSGPVKSIRIVWMGDMWEVYVNDALQINCHVAGSFCRDIGFFAEEGETTFAGMTVRVAE